MEDDTFIILIDGIELHIKNYIQILELHDMSSTRY